MKILIFIAALFGSTILFAQTQNENPIINDITSIQKNIEKQNKEIVNLNSKVGKQNALIEKFSKEVNKLEIVNDSLSKSIGTNRSNITSIAKELGTKIQTTEKNAIESISKLDNDVEKNRLYWIIGTLVTLLLGGFIYWLLGKRITSSQTDVEIQIRNTKKSLEEESLKLDAQLLEIINSQLKIKETQIDSKPESGEKDHSLVLKVADEVTRILMNLEVMDKEIKGYKQLKKYSESILDNLKAYGYEIPQLIGVNYNSGMNMVATLEFDESVESGKQIIKRIVKPQVNFDGKMIQAAKVTVAFNE
ncbi:hypothetical protein [Flavobacterium sp.]